MEEEKFCSQYRPVVYIQFQLLSVALTGRAKFIHDSTSVQSCVSCPECNLPTNQITWIINDNITKSKKTLVFSGSLVSCPLRTHTVHLILSMSLSITMNTAHRRNCSCASIERIINLRQQSRVHVCAAGEITWHETCVRCPFRYVHLLLNVEAKQKQKVGIISVWLKLNCVFRETTDTQALHA